MFLEPGGNVDAVAHEVASVAQNIAVVQCRTQHQAMAAETRFLLDIAYPPYRVGGPIKGDENPITCGFHQHTAMFFKQRKYDFRPQRNPPLVGPFFVHLHHLRKADNVQETDAGLVTGAERDCFGRGLRAGRHFIRRQGHRSRWWPMRNLPPGMGGVVRSLEIQSAVKHNPPFSRALCVDSR